MFAPFGSRWYSGDAIFIIDWVYWLLLGAGLFWSIRRERRGAPAPEWPARVAGVLLLVYIAGNVLWSTLAERSMARALRERGIEPTLVVASPPPLRFWDRTLAWRSRDRWGQGSFGPGGLQVEPGSRPLGLDDSRFLKARAEQRRVRSFLYWSRMPIVVEQGGQAFLADQRYYRAFSDPRLPAAIRRRNPRGSFMLPLTDGP